MTATNFALSMLEKSYSPYSNFAVGACIEFEDGKIVGGCNVENSSYGLCMCAERNAIFSAIAQGFDLQKAKAIYIATKSDILTPPCGACLQVMVEFWKDVDIYLVNHTSKAKYKLSELIPFAFSKDNL